MNLIVLSYFTKLTLLKTIISKPVLANGTETLCQN